MWKRFPNAYKSPLNEGSKIQFQKSPKNRPGDPSAPSRSNWKMFSLDTSLGNTRLSHLLSIWVKTNKKHTCPVSKQHPSDLLHSILFMFPTRMNWPEAAGPIPISFCSINLKKPECAASQFMFHGHNRDRISWFYVKSKQVSYRGLQQQPSGVDVWCVWGNTNVLKTQSHLCPKHCCSGHKIKWLKVKINTAVLQLVWWSLCANCNHSVLTITLSSHPLGLNSKAEWMAPF